MTTECQHIFDKLLEEVNADWRGQLDLAYSLGVIDEETYIAAIARLSGDGIGQGETVTI